MTPKKSDDMVKILLDRVPAFRDSRLARETLTPDDYELPYVVFGRFATFLNELLRSTSSDDITVLESFRLLNDMGNSSDQGIANLVAVGVYEVLLDSPQSVHMARQLLYGKAIDLFETMIQTWGVEGQEP